MNWSRDKSLLLSQICVAVFAALLLALDIGCRWAATWFVQVRLMREQLGYLLMATVYVCSVFAWVLLASLWRLLGRLRRGEVFIPANVRLLRTVSWCCFGAAAVCLLSCLYYLPFAFAAAAAAFMALIVRIVKNGFQQACGMQDEVGLPV